MRHKYVNINRIGFIIWPRTDVVIHADMARIVRPCNIVSAGFVRFDNGRAVCYVRSESLNLDSQPGDSDALNKQLFGASQTEYGAVIADEWRRDNTPMSPAIEPKQSVAWFWPKQLFGRKRDE